MAWQPHSFELHKAAVALGTVRGSIIIYHGYYYSIPLFIMFVMLIKVIVVSVRVGAFSSNLGFGLQFSGVGFQFTFDKWFGAFSLGLGV